jgi:2-methylcitrate dehydratase
MEQVIRELARYACNTRFAQLPGHVLHETKRRLVDSVACAVGAYDEAFCERIRALTRSYAGTPPARVWGTGAPTSIEMAGFANGTMVRYLDFNDTWLGRGAGHPSDMIPSLVALAEGSGADGGALIAAIVVAYELYCSLCEAAFRGRVLDQATAAAVGTAAGAANLLRLDEQRTANALSLALSANLALYNVRTGELSDWKGAAGPNGARNGLFAAELARAGVTGPTAPVSGKGGLADIAGAFEWKAGAGPAPLLMNTHIKLHPVCYHGQTAVDAALRLRGAVPLADIESIQVDTYEAAYEAMGSDDGRWAPATRETADHSQPYTIAMALREGRLDTRIYDADRLGDPETKRIMDKIRVSASEEFTRDYPRLAQTRITLRAKDGGVHSHLQELPRGHARNPVPDAELEQKFRSAYGSWGDDAAASRTLSVLWNAERLASAAELVNALCTSN